MFYILTFSAFVLAVGVYAVLCFTVGKKDPDRFSARTDQFLRVATVVYCAIVMLSLILPDAFPVTQGWADKPDGQEVLAMLRWCNAFSFVMIPMAVFFRGKRMTDITCFFSPIFTVLSAISYEKYIAGFTDIVTGRGLNALDTTSDATREFLCNETFRSIVFGVTLVLEFAVPVILALRERKTVFRLRGKDLWQTPLFALLLFCACVPAFVPQNLVGYTKIAFTPYSLPHIAWMVCMVAEIVILYRVFRNKEEKVKWMLVFFLSLCLLLQYNQLFSFVSLGFRSFPLQLCNLASYLILAALITKNRHLFNFTVIVNVLGVLFALAIPDLNDKGFLNLFNVHYILEHTNVLVIPVLCLLLGLFPRIDRRTLRDCLTGYAIYYVVILLFGTFCNALSAYHGGVDTPLGGTLWVNYLFMFHPDYAEKNLLPFAGKLFGPAVHVGEYVTFYPLGQAIVFFVFALLCVAIWAGIRGVYKLADRLTGKKTTD